MEDDQQQPSNAVAPPVPFPSDGKIPLSERQNPDPDQTPIITLDKITVRPLRAADAEQLSALANHASIASRMRNRFPHPYRLEDAQTFINTRNDPSNFIDRGPFDPATGKGTGPSAPATFAICLDDALIGAMGIDFGSDVEVRCAELGYWIGEAFWGRGIMSRVAGAVIPWAWRTYGRLLRLEAVVFEGNPGSVRVLEKCGMTRLPRKEKAVYKDGKVLALDCFEMVRGDEE